MEKTKDDTMEFDITEEDENVLLNDINKLEDQKVCTMISTQANIFCINMSTHIVSTKIK